jgi:hypothetical protein
MSRLQHVIYVYMNELGNESLTECFDWKAVVSMLLVPIFSGVYDVQTEQKVKLMFFYVAKMEPSVTCCGYSICRLAYRREYSTRNAVLPL